MVKDVPFISERNAKYLYELIIREELSDILELGIAHGTATCYMAAALDEMGTGKITSVDLIETADAFKPSPEEQVVNTGLDKFVEIVRMQTGYNWFLHDEIKRQTQNDICSPKYDLCIIDGPKNWTIDGAAFFMADKLLKEDGLIIFDDYLWRYDSNNRDATDGITHRSLSEPEQSTPQIQEVFELLVKQHPNYSEFTVDPSTGWATARKAVSDNKTYTVTYNQTNKDVLTAVVQGMKKFGVVRK